MFEHRPSLPLRVLAKPDACQPCVGWAWSRHGAGQGFVPAEGSGRNGVLVVLEAAGADEEDAGLPTVGKAGYYLWTQLAKAGLERDDFRIHNILSCRPPNNFLAKAPYEAAAIAACDQHLSATVRDMQERCAAAGQHLTILALGQIAFRTVMGLDSRAPLMHVKGGYRGYVHRTEKWGGAWVVAADHPAYLMRGNHHEVPILLYAAQRAVDVAREGFVYPTPSYICDPDPQVFAGWVRAYRERLAAVPAETFLSFDIETPLKAKKDEEELAREEDEDYIILRCAFAYEPWHAVSVPWQAPYMAALEELFGEPLNKLVTWNGSYDCPRVRNQLTLRGEHHDAMLAWHVLNSALEKKLGFVTPFYVKNAPVWKHLSERLPAHYNAADADMALQIYHGVRADLARSNQQHVFDRHVILLHRVTDAMSEAGLCRDEAGRAAAEATLTTLLDGVEVNMASAVPQEVRRLHPPKGFTRTPLVSVEGIGKIPVSDPRAEAAASASGFVLRDFDVPVKVCGGCGLPNPPAAHFKPFGPKALKERMAACTVCPTLALTAGTDVAIGAQECPSCQQPCEGKAKVTVVHRVSRWCRQEAFKLSKVQLTSYQAQLKHQAVWNRKENRTTFDELAIRALVKKYPKDPLYPLILNHRKYQKLLGTYIGVTQIDGTVRGGLRIGQDGRIHPEFTSNPNTLRMACQNPNIQNLPRGGDAEGLEILVRSLVVASPGSELVELDFSAIEAVLVAYFARWPEGIRLAKLGIHSYLASHVLKRPADLTWSDADLKAYFQEIKRSKDADVQRVYNGSKRTVHLSGYGGTPRKMAQAEPDVFPNEKYAKWLQDIYWEVARPVKKWQLETQLEAHQNGFLRNPFGYVLRFTHVFRNVKEAGVWVRKPGDQANDVLAFLPQSSAAGIIKEAMLRLYFDRDVTRPWLRLQVHDSLVSDVPLGLADEVISVKRTEMEKPVPELPLPASWGMGTHLQIDVEAKRGLNWGKMRAA